MSDIIQLNDEILELKKQLFKKQCELLEKKQKCTDSEKMLQSSVPKWAIERYSRQLLVTDLALPLQNAKCLMNSSVLVVGAGGLGCPALGYLAGAGIGHLGIVDYDVVELTNIHRQLLHTEVTVGMPKTDSAALALSNINSNIKVTPYNLLLDSCNAMDIIRQYDVVVDATDNVVTRYLLNDACVLAGKPLVSASALKMEGQLTIYNHDTAESSGVCMRCIFPLPPPAEAVGSCSQQGVLGPVPGLMGTLQALETIKLLLGRPTIAGQMLIFDGMDCTFRTVKLRGKNPCCSVCSASPSITQLIDYTQFCNAQPSDKDMDLKILRSDQRISPQEFYNNIYTKFIQGGSCDDGEVTLKTYNGRLLIDVRSKGEYDMCSIEGSCNVPIDEMHLMVDSIRDCRAGEVYFVCRRGNDSQIAGKLLLDALAKDEKVPIIRDIVGGLHAWAKDVDSNFPVY